MLQAIQRNWEEFRHSEPGRRFQERYARKRTNGPLKRALVLAAGLVLLVLGLFFAIAPGPGFLFLIPGAALLAQESNTLARALDRLELWLRKMRRRNR